LISLVEEAMKLRTWRLLSIAMLMSVAILAAMGAADPSQSSESRHASGIMILRGEQAVPDALPEEVAQALDAAMSASAADPINFSYPFVNQKSRTVVATVATAAGQAQAEELHATVAQAADGALVGFAVQPVQHSRQFLDQLMDEVIGRQPEGVIVIASYPEPEHNRIVAEVAKIDDAFLYRLARSYGTAAIAVRLTEADAGMPASREADTSPFWGGADVNGCTTGFAWHSGTTDMMVTAGHCFSSGGSASTPAQSMGSVRSGDEESWNSGTGTVYMTGQSTYRGDIALIRIYSGKYSAARIYRGGYNSSTNAPVAGKWSRGPASGDQYCTGGRASGEQCGWKVVWSATGNYTYNSGEVARRVWRGDKRGWCIKAGDSGGPVYTVRSDGYVVAKGIISGATGFGGSDAYAGLFDTPCRNIFTNIWDAYYGFPGDIN
jgi:hypothetical protein